MCISGIKEIDQNGYFYSLEMKKVTNHGCIWSYGE